MRFRWLPRFVPVVAILGSLASLSCSSGLDPTTRPTVSTDVASDLASPNADTALAGSTTQPGFYPLTVGNRWDYQQDVVVQLFSDSGGTQLREESRYLIVRRIVDPVAIDGREYLGEQTTSFPISSGGVIIEGYALLRQDATGLYEWSPIIGTSGPTAGATPSGRAFHISAPAGRSPAEHAAYQVAARRLEERIAAVEAAIGRGGAAGFGMRLPPTPAPNEVTLLRYPLVPKSPWPIRQDRRFHSSAVVIGQERLNLPPGRMLGYRIDVTSDALGPRDFVRLWYGRAGFLQQISHFELEAYDQNATEIGRYIFDEQVRLYGIELVPPPPKSPFVSWSPRRPK